VINKADQGIARPRPAVLKWADSKKTADDIKNFMNWFNTKPARPSGGW